MSMHSLFVPWATLNLNFGAAEIAASNEVMKAGLGWVIIHSQKASFLPAPALKPETLGWF